MSRSLLFPLLLAPLALTPGATPAQENPQSPAVTIIRHSAWSDQPPLGVEANGIRRNLGEGDSVTFERLTVTLTTSTLGLNEPDRAHLRLQTSSSIGTRAVPEGGAFNWSDYHIAIPAIYAEKGELGFPYTVVEIADVNTLPPRVAESTSANGAEDRLRVPHTLDKLTLHHSATVLREEDDLAQKLRNMQSWGANARQWWDLPYHFIIDVDGTVFEGRDYRFVGDTNTQYDPTGHFLINCYGNYNEQEPSPAQLDAIVNLMAWAAMEYDIDPSEIYGHSDLAETECPGDALEALLHDGTIERRVRAVMEKGQPRLRYGDEGGAGAEEK
ncbi:MAG: N-acetylmuramoyl-L-alanine amidase [Sumerlaeia bacterium]